MFNIFKRSKGAVEPQEFFFKTDIHCHVLPGIDDGSPDAATSVELIKRMKAWGLERIIASPHVTNLTFPNTPETVGAAREALKKALADDGSDIVIENSAEYRIDDLFARELEAERLMTLPNNYILIENPFVREPGNLDSVIFDLQVRGLRPILVHPERYSYYYKHPERYEVLHNAGAMFQINVLSLAGGYGKDERKIAEMLIEKGLVDFVGTDLHNAAHADIIDRYLASSDYLKDRDRLKGRILNDKAFN